MSGNYLGVVLAGGKSRRFGSDKALAMLDARPLIAHALAALRPQVAEVVIAGRDWDGQTGLADCPAPGLGPLGGLCAALRHAQASGHDAVVSVACDTPLLPTDLVVRLASAGAAAFVADLPVVGLWPAEFAERLEARLRETEDRSMRGWAAAIGATAVSLRTQLYNVNTMQDFSLLRQRLARS